VENIYPGMSGLAQLFPATILLLKGYKIKGLQPMDLPSNWISIHPGLRQKVVVSIFQRCEKISKRFAARILNGERVFKGLLSLPIDLLISPILRYYFRCGYDCDRLPGYLFQLLDHPLFAEIQIFQCSFELHVAYPVKILAKVFCPENVSPEKLITLIIPCTLFRNQNLSIIIAKI
jgi:hypothetical protein